MAAVTCVKTATDNVVWQTAVFSGSRWASSPLYVHRTPGGGGRVAEAAGGVWATSGSGRGVTQLIQ